MAGNSFGEIFKITSFGESHGPALGVVIDGMPAGIEINQADLQAMLERRAPGRSKTQTDRFEPDQAQILSGIFEDKTLGSPISVIIENKNPKSSDYDKLNAEYRPGHADKTTELKYGIRDHRGGGRSSGRETVSRVIAGYFAGLIIPKVKVTSSMQQVGELTQFSEEELHSYLMKIKEAHDSVGGIVQTIIENVPVGLGEPVFDKLKADLAKAMLSIGACTGFSYGLGFEFAKLRGSQTTTHQSSFGGLEGGITNGDNINFQYAFRGPSTVGEKAKLGRHDPCILPRVLVVIEAMTKIVLADHFLRNQVSKSNW